MGYYMTMEHRRFIKTLLELSGDVEEAANAMRKFRKKWESRLQQLESEVGPNQRKRIGILMHRLEKAIDGEDDA